MQYEDGSDVEGNFVDDGDNRDVQSASNSNKDRLFGGVGNVSKNEQDTHIGEIVVSGRVSDSDLLDENTNQITDIVSSSSPGPIVDTVSQQLSSVIPSATLEYRISINFQVHDLIKHDFLIKSDRSESIWTPYIDSGAQRSVMSKHFADRLGLKILKDINFTVIGFDQKPSKLVYGWVKDVKLVVPGTDNILYFSPIIMDDPHANLCGLDVIIPAGGGEIVQVSPYGARYLFHSEKRVPQVSSIRIYAGEKTLLKPGESRFVEINSCQNKVEGDIIIESTKRNNNLCLYDGIANNSVKRVKIFNNSIDKSIMVQKNQLLGYAYPGELADKQVLGEIPDLEFQNNAENKIDISKLIDKKLGESVFKKPETREKLKQILLKNIDAFDIGSKSVGKFYKKVTINPQEKSIELKPEKRRTFNPNVASQVNSQLDKFESLGLIEDCKFPLVSPANIVAARRNSTNQNISVLISKF